MSRPATPWLPREGKEDQGKGGPQEVELGRIATQNASNPRVKEFGQRMVDDHTKADDDLKQLATRENVTLPTSMNREDKKEVDRLSKLHGAAFDSAYMKAMVDDHEKDVKEFRQESESARDSDVKDFASHTLPTLEQHLQMAKDIHAQRGSATSGARRRSD